MGRKCGGGARVVPEERPGLPNGRGTEVPTPKPHKRRFTEKAIWYPWLGKSLYDNTTL